jgi:hypothetical protein
MDEGGEDYLMRRILFKICAAISVIILGLSTFLFIRSFLVRDDIDIKLSQTRVIFFESSKGAFRVIYVRDLGDSGMAGFLPLKDSYIALVHEVPPSDLDISEFGLDGWDKHKYGFELGECYAEYIYSEKLLKVPDWFVAVIATILPVTWLLFARHSRNRRKLGLCPRCGYDVRASPDRCSECGQALSTSIKTADSRQGPI